MNKSSGILLVILVVVAILAVTVFTCSYTVREDEQAVLLEFGKVSGDPVTEPGLHFKLPWFEARKFEKRWLAWDGDPNQITTLDKRYILIDVFARWKIVDPIVFIEKLRDEQSAQGRLDDILDSATRNVIANHNLIEAIRSTDRQFVISNEEKENQMSSVGDVDAEIAAMEKPSPSDAEKLIAAVGAEGALDAGEKANAAVSDKTAGVADTDNTDDTSATEPGEANADDTANGTAGDTEPSADDLVKDNNIDIDAAVASTDTDASSGDSSTNIYKIAVGRQALTEQIIEKASQKAMELGIELKDVRLKRIDYIPSVQESVFKRMISERTKVASRLRSQGEGLSAKILGRKDRDLKRIQSEAYKKAEEIRGRADAAAARIYAEAYKRDPELYRFLKTLESYRNTLGERTWLLITTDSEYGAYLKSAK
jgi:regulator of protease activity HflC (stomatin/prohibitin superfamily)